VSRQRQGSRTGAVNTGAVYAFDTSRLDCIRQYCIDFELEDDDLTPLVNGQDVSPADEFGRRYTVDGSSSVGLASAIFDSRSLGLNAGGDDPDLLVNLGNVLIAQGRPGQSQPGIFDVPDDDRRGGDFRIEFLGSPVRLLSIDLVDIDDIPVQNATVTLVDQLGRERSFLARSGWTEDIVVDGPPGYRTLDLGNLHRQPGFHALSAATEDPEFDAAAVVRLRVHFDGSAALDNVRYCVGPPETTGRRTRRLREPGGLAVR